MLPELEKWKNDGRYIEVSGQRIFVKQAGSGEDLVLVHGYPTSSFDYAHIWPRLVERYRVTTLDMLGMGFSSKPWRRYSVMDHADTYEAVLTHFGIDRTRVLAHDLGDTVVQEMLARRLDRPEIRPRLVAVALLNGGLFAGVYRPRPIQRWLSSPWGHLIGPLLPKSAVLKALRSVYSKQYPPSDRVLEQSWELIAFNHGNRVAHLVGRFNQERERFGERWRNALIQTAVPLRFINGTADPNSGEHMAQAYEKFIKNADVVRLEGVGHWPQIEVPSAVADHVLSFFAADSRRAN